MEKRKRQTYSEEYKIEAIKMVLEEGKTVPEVASQLGIQPNQLYNWMQSHRLPGEIKAMINKQKEQEVGQRHQLCVDSRRLALFMRLYRPFLSFRDWLVNE